MSKIGSILGYPSKSDKYTKDKSMLKYARLMVEMPLEGQFPEHVEFANEKGVLIRQKVIYEWLPTKCDKCKMFGHVQEHYRKQEQQKKEWRVKPTRGNINTASQAEETEGTTEVREIAEGFQTVSGQKNHRPIIEKSPVPMPLTNTYNVLMEGEEPQDSEEKRGEGDSSPHG